MGVLGGGGSQTLFGHRVHSGSTRVGLAASVGGDLPKEALEWLVEADVDISAMQVVEGRQTPRAWQVQSLTHALRPPSRAYTQKSTPLRAGLRVGWTTE